MSLSDIINTYNLNGDSIEAKYVGLSAVSKTVPHGIFVEVGFRQGTGMLSTILGRTVSDVDLFIAIDPYGNIPYRLGDQSVHYDYTNSMRIKTLTNFYRYLHDNFEERINFMFLNMESNEYINRFTDGIPDYYTGTKIIRNDYSLVHLDGQHDTDTVMSEVNFFAPRLNPGGIIAIDDTSQNWMDMSVLVDRLTELNCILDTSIHTEQNSSHDKLFYRKLIT
jgi:hypothetical protein